MPILSRSSRTLALVASGLVVPWIAIAQDPPKPGPKAEAPARPLGPGEFPDEVPLRPPSPGDGAAIKPLPPVAIPDDPPPHEGAFFDLPMTIEPPDIIVVEVLEAMPGRPITGERLVRPDGTISLGFYGEVHVRGLTPRQAKAKIIHHLRNFLDDDVLGLVQLVPDPAGGAAIPPPEAGPEKKAEPVPDEAPPARKKPEREARRGDRKGARDSSSLSNQANKKGNRPVFRTSRLVRPDAPNADRPDSHARGQEPGARPGPGEEMVELEVLQARGKLAVTQPSDSTHVFVDFAAHNSHVYFVQGDVGVPGRLPWTGGEAVLDALNYAGGFIPTAEPLDVHLHRPARGGKPARDYRLDFEAIKKGDVAANLQVFPGDRIVVGRNPIVARNVDVDRAAALINSLMHSSLEYSMTARSLGAINLPPAGVGTAPSRADAPGSQPMPPAIRDAMLKDWADYLWSISSKEGGAMLDEKAFKEALLKKLAPAPGPK